LPPDKVEWLPQVLGRIVRLAPSIDTTFLEDVVLIARKLVAGLNQTSPDEDQAKKLYLAVFPPLIHLMAAQNMMPLSQAQANIGWLIYDFLWPAGMLNIQQTKLPSDFVLPSFSFLPSFLSSQRIEWRDPRLKLQGHGSCWIQSSLKT